MEKRNHQKKIAIAMSGPSKTDLLSGRGTRKVAIALSGGVDSGVAAALLVQAGYECVGFHLKLTSPPGCQAGAPAKAMTPRGWIVEENLTAVRDTCQQLEIPFEVLDCTRVFQKQVIDYFLKSYASGLTPNPCVVCNRKIKFGWLLDYVRGQGFDYLATGHYARVANEGAGANFSHSSQFVLSSKVVRKDHSRSSSSRSSAQSRLRFSYYLLRARDERKDQSYFLYRLTQKQLAHVLFPLGEMTKGEVRGLAKRWRLPVAKSKESQDICFLSETNRQDYLLDNISNKIVSGKVVTLNGEVIGGHQGLPLYTIGQRTGFKITSTKYQRARKGKMPVHYVVGKEVKKNQLVVGTRKEAEKKDFWVNDLSWVNKDTPGVKSADTPGVNGPKELFVKIRSTGKLLKVKNTSEVRRLRLKIVLEEPVVGIAPGQSAVFYARRETQDERRKTRDFEVLGGGIISD